MAIQLASAAVTAFSPAPGAISVIKLLEKMNPNVPIIVDKIKMNLTENENTAEASSITTLKNGSPVIQAPYKEVKKREKLSGLYR